jgi:RNA polymerase sigma-70 factor (ECF subfamily)
MELDDLANEVSDETVLLAMSQGMPEALTIFMRRFQGRIYGLAFTVVHDESLAEEIAQEAILKIWRHAAMYDPRRGTVATWALAITRHVAIDCVRVRVLPKADPELLFRSELQSGESSPEEQAILGASVEFLKHALRRLPDDQRRALLLASFYGKTAREIALDEDIPLGTAKTRLRSALASLRKQFVVEGYLNP